MIARDIFEECFAIYLSTYGFEDKKDEIVKHLLTKSKEDLHNARLYTLNEHVEAWKRQVTAKLIETLILRAMFILKEKNKIVEG